jgi:hypothetical protein
LLPAALSNLNKPFPFRDKIKGRSSDGPPFFYVLQKSEQGDIKLTVALSLSKGALARDDNGLNLEPSPQRRLGSQAVVQ